MELRLAFAAVRLPVNPTSLFKSSEDIYIIQDFSAVVIICCVIKTVGVVQAVCVMLFSFVAFNLEHYVSFDDFFELLECLLNFRKWAAKNESSIPVVIFIGDRFNLSLSINVFLN